MRTSILFGFSILCLAASAKPWPTQDWQTDEAFKQAHAGKLKQIDGYLFSDKSVTDGALIIKSGQVVYERYAHGYGPKNRHLVWSASKSILNALVGIAVGEKKLALSDSICRYVPIPAEKSQANCAITVDDLLHWSSGLQWNEAYESTQSPMLSSILAMLYGVGRHDMATFIQGHDLTAKPGENWAYSSGDSTLLAAVVQAAMGARGETFAWDSLFNPIGMKETIWESDAKGTLVGASYVWANARELAKFGYLFLNDGVWDGKRILPEGWVKQSLAVSPSILKHAKAVGIRNLSGAQWWTNQALPEFGNKSPWKGVPADAFMASGHWGQYIVVIPSWDMIIVRVGDDRMGAGFNPVKLAKLVGALVGAHSTDDGEDVEPTEDASSAKPREYKNTEVELGLGFTAKEYCSCRFVAGLSDEACRAYVKIPQVTPTIASDDAAKTVTASFMIFGGSASFVDDHHGCRLK